MGVEIEFGAVLSSLIRLRQTPKRRSNTLARSRNWIYSAVVLGFDSRNSRVF